MALKIRNANQFGRLSEKRLEQLEKRLRGRLPEDYRSFLLRHNGGRPTLSRFTFPLDGEEQETILEWFFAVHDQPYEEPEDWSPDDWDPDSGELPPYFGQSLEEVWADLRSEKPRAGVLPIGRDPGGSLICLGYAGKRVGKIYYYDHETDSFINLADSFTDFLSCLRKLPPGDWAPWLVVE
jgi:hypothetical protein